MSTTTTPIPTHIGFGVARVGDRVEGYCNGPGHIQEKPFTGVWVHGSEHSRADGLSIIRVGDTGITDCGHIFWATTGSGVCRSNDREIHRVGDEVRTEGDGVGYTVTGSNIVYCR